MSAHEPHEIELEKKDGRCDSGMTCLAKMTGRLLLLQRGFRFLLLRHFHCRAETIGSRMFRYQLGSNCRKVYVGVQESLPTFHRTGLLAVHAPFKTARPTNGSQRRFLSSSNFLRSQDISHRDYLRVRAVSNYVTLNVTETLKMCVISFARFRMFGLKTSALLTWLRIFASSKLLRSCATMLRVL